MSQAPIALIGEVFCDYLSYPDIPSKLRLGGIIHSARALWALNVPYIALYIAPSYLNGEIERYLYAHGCKKAVSMGIVDGSPNVMMVGEPKEAGPQKYENLLFKSKKVSINYDSLKLIENEKVEKTLLITGDYNLKDLLEKIESSELKIFIDFANGETTTDLLADTRIHHIYLSTSSKFFIKDCHASFDYLCKFLAGNKIDSFTLKEGRGGSRTFFNNEVIQTPAFLLNTAHSVGVGDVFDAVHVSTIDTHPQQSSLLLAALIASDYASTTYPDDFKSLAGEKIAISATELLNSGGVCLRWEDRPQKNVYVAAPDFDYVDTHYVDVLATAISYHNFNPRLPVREHGQANLLLQKKDRLKLAQLDTELLLKCDALIAVNIFDDPGTLIEVGMALNAGKPTLIFDPYKRAKNLMLTELPLLVTNSLDEIVNELFIIFQEPKNEKG